MRKLILLTGLVFCLSIQSCDPLDDEVILGLPFELSESLKIEIEENSDANFESIFIIDPEEDSSVVSNAENIKGIEISHLYYKITGLTADAESSFSSCVITYGNHENSILDTLAILDGYNIEELSGEDHLVELSSEMSEQLNSILSTREPIYVFVDGTTSTTPVSFTLTIWAELILRVTV